MNKNKISKRLLTNVSILSRKKQLAIIHCNDFSKTKTFLETNGFCYRPHRFAECISVECDNDDLNVLSELTSVQFIYDNTTVSNRKHEKFLVNIDKLTEEKYLGQDQTICFIDTGIHPHLDFTLPHNRIVKFIDLINHHTIPYDDNGHGTFVSGIASGNGIFSPTNRGFAPLSKIISIKALDSKGNSTSNTILDAMEWVYQNHKAYKISIVCMSFGADCELNLDPLSKGAEALWKKGLIVVAAAGNSGPEKNTIKSPGNNPNIITVGALDTTNQSVAEFSSRGPTIFGHKPDLLAPAVDITSCNNSARPYTQMSGTSVATPIIAGICADIKSKYPNMTNIEIKKFLLSHCSHITGDVDIEGAGYINF